MLIQVILLAAVVSCLVLFVRAKNGVRLRAGKRLAFLGFVALNVYAILRPDDVALVANALGVGRGTDLLVYLLVMTFIFVVISFYLRLKDGERRVTDLARAVALKEGEALSRERGLH
jgi:hypothetical protein